MVNQSSRPDMASTGFILAAENAGTPTLSVLSTRQNSTAYPNTLQLNNIAGATVTEAKTVSQVFTATNESTNSHRKIHAATSPMMLPARVTRRFSAKTSMIMRPRVEPKALRTPSSVRRRRRKLWVIPERLIAGTIRRMA